MKLHWLQHVPFEGLGHIETWAQGNGVELSCTRLFAHETLPSIDAFDGLVVMGGPMGVHDEQIHPWLASEKAFIKSAIDEARPVLGICLGAQLIADVLGTRVYPGPEKEIGWFPIQKQDETIDWLPPETTVFHWHGDTFDIPKEARLLAKSAAGINQGFVYRSHVVALQFHLETTPEGAESLIQNCSHELVDAPFIQTTEEIRAGMNHLSTANIVLEKLLDSIFWPIERE